MAFVAHGGRNSRATDEVRALAKPATPQRPTPPKVISLWLARLVAFASVLTAILFSTSGELGGQGNPGGGEGGESGCAIYLNWTQQPPSATQALTVPAGLSFGWTGAIGPNGQTLLCDVESQPDLSATLQFTVNGVDRTSHFTSAQVSLGGWTASATVVPVVDGTTNQHVVQVGTSSIANLYASTVVNSHPLALWQGTGATATRNRNLALCAMDCFEAVIGYSTPAYFSRDVPRSATLLYRSSMARPMGVVELETQGSNSPAPLYYELRLRRPNGTYVTLTNGQQVLYVQHQFGRQRLTLQFDAASLATGSYQYTVIVKGVWSDGATREQISGVRVLVNNASTSEFGWGWRLAGEQQIYSESDGLVVTGGDGSAAFFRKYVGMAGYETPDGDFSVISDLAQPQADGAIWERAYPDSTKYRFRSDGRLTRIVNRFGHATTFNRLNGWQLHQLTDPQGKSLTFTYGSNGKLLNISDPAGRVSFVDMDGAGNVYQIRDPESSTSIAMAATYDAYHRVVHRDDRAGSRWTFGYDHTSSVAVDSTPAVLTNGSTTAQRIALRTRSWLSVAIPDPVTSVGNSTTNLAPAINPDTASATTTDGEGHVTKYRFDSWGQPVAIVNAVGQLTSITRSGLFATSIAHPTGAVDEYRYIGPNLVYARQHQRDSVLYRYGSGYAQPDSIWGPNRPSQRIFIGLKGRVDSIRVGGAKVTRYNYDTQFRVVSVVDNGATNESGAFVKHTTTFRYDPTWGNVDSVMAPAGRWTRTIHDAYGRPQSVRSLGAARTWEQYDVLNRPIKQWTEGWAPIDTILTFHGRVAIDSIRDGRGQRYRDVVNAIGWVVSSHDPDASKLPRTFTYDRNGRPIAQSNRRGQSIHVTYDAIGRIVKRWGTGLQTDSIWYSANGLQVVGTNTVSIDTLTYNAKGELTSSVKSLDGLSTKRFEVAYAYDSRGRRTNHVVTSPANGPAFVKPIRVYATDGTLSQLNIQYGSNTLINSFKYNEELQRDTTVFSDGMIRSQFFTTNHEVYATSFSQGSRAQAFRRTYARDSLGRITELRRPSYSSTYDERVKYAYDGKGQLSGTQIIENTPCDGPSDPDFGQVVCDNGTSTAITYDAVANRLASFGVLGVFGLANRIQTWGSIAFGVDNDGNTTGRSSPARSYTWDPTNRLSCSSDGSVETCFDYNAFGEIVRRRTAGTVDRWFLWSDGQFLAELDAATMKRIGEYVYTPGVDAPMALVTGDSTVATVRYFEQDELGNVAGLHGPLDVVHQRISYDAWGVATVTHGTVADTSRLRWKGLVWEASIGLYYMRSRWYDPQLGRFVSEDPIGLDAGINMYAYGQGDPINTIDPLGLCEYKYTNTSTAGTVYHANTGEQIHGRSSSGQPTTYTCGCNHQWHQGDFAFKESDCSTPTTVPPNVVPSSRDPYRGGGTGRRGRGRGTASDATNVSIFPEAEVVRVNTIGNTGDWWTGCSASGAIQAAGWGALGKAAANAGNVGGQRIRATLPGVPSPEYHQIRPGAGAAGIRSGLIWGAVGGAGYYAGGCAWSHAGEISAQKSQTRDVGRSY